MKMGCASAMTVLSSCAPHQEFNGVAMAPMLVAARNATIHSCDRGTVIPAGVCIPGKGLCLPRKGVCLPRKGVCLPREEVPYREVAHGYCHTVSVLYSANSQHVMSKGPGSRIDLECWKR